MTGIAGRMARGFINSKLTPLLILASLVLGLGGVISTPREEEPQISVPMVDVFTELPGAAPEEVERRLLEPVERRLWEISGVEHLYSVATTGGAMTTVRFRVGDDPERSVVKVFAKLSGTPALVKLHTIDEVPILTLTFWGGGYDGYRLRQVVAELRNELQRIPDVAQLELTGGEPRTVLVEPDPARLATFGLAADRLVAGLQAANLVLPAGAVLSDNRTLPVRDGRFLATAEDVAQTVVAVAGDRAVRVADVATVTDGPGEPAWYVSHLSRESRGAQPAVTLSLAKRPGVNAAHLAQEVLGRVQALRGTLLPREIELTVTRNYGQTADEKAGELLSHILVATVGVALLVWLALGRREALVVLVAVPVTLALTLLVYKLLGYTLNRITLFALVFAIGILVDDAIVVVENIARHWRMPENEDRPPFEVAVEAVDEVGNPTILATLAVIAAILPMAFVGGLMGPYMRPIPIGASAAMMFSLVVAFVVTPWAAVRILKRTGAAHAHGGEPVLTRAYRRIMGSLLHYPLARWSFLAVVVVLLLASCSLFYFGFVKVKMLPFDNKSEFQVIVDMPNGTTLEETARVAQLLAQEAARQPDVINLQTYAGAASPYNFNGLVRHYYLRHGPNVADIQINLQSKDRRNLQSHDIAKQVRTRLQPIADQSGARIKVAEVPPGPPVLETLVAEVYGPELDRRIGLGRELRDLFKRTDGVVDTDWYVEDDQTKYRLVVDEEKAALNGITETDITKTLQVASAGYRGGLLHVDSEKEDVPLIIRLDRASRSDLESICALRVAGRSGKLVALSEMTRVERTINDKSIYHKNLMPVTYVTADVAGAMESPVYAILKLGPEIDRINIPEGYQIEQHMAAVPSEADRYSMKWDGEWHVTYEVFRDLGIAFAAVLILIYGLVVGWFQSFLTPLMIMAAIPF
ncbi:MAG TPA: efflux RND transporter permease subunit, partial [Gemmatimonadales bacterium]|nr:efflux RND transporter permease subunit [Gemmatimonadales bacterium]